MLKCNKKFIFSLPLSLILSSCGAITVNAPNTTTISMNAATAGGSKIYALGGTVSGLSGSSLSLQNNGSDTLSLNTNSSFNFATLLASSASYSITVSQQPTNAFCSVTNGSGIVSSSAISNVAVNCYLLGQPSWANSTTSASLDSQFDAVATSSNGNTYAVGSIDGNSLFTLSNGITASGVSTGLNLMIAKYNASGTLQWATSTTTTNNNELSALGVALDTSENVYAVGNLNADTSYNVNLGNGVTAVGGHWGSNFIIMKYNSSGVAQWATTTANDGGSWSAYSGVALDASNNSYAVGYISGTGSYNFGNSVTAAGTGAGSNNNPVIAKYNSLGAAQWAKTLTSGTTGGYFQTVATDSSGNSYAVGSLNSNVVFGFGNSITVTPRVNAADNLLIVKYNSSGLAQWAKSTSASGSSNTYFNGVALDSLGNVYAVGTIYGTSTYGLGNSVTITGLTSGANIIIVKYNSAGVTQWAKTTTSGSWDSTFNSIAIDSSDNIYTAGHITGSSTFGFGNSITATGANGSGNNSLVVKYNTSGVAQAAKTTTSASADSDLYGISVDSSSNLSTVGNLNGNSSFSFGNNVTATGNYGSSTNLFILQYEHGM